MQTFHTYESKKPKDIDEDTCIRIIENIDDVPMRIVLYICLYAGLRINDAVSLRIENVDCRDHRLLYKQGKTQRDRVVPIIPKLQVILYPYLMYALRRNGIGCLFSSRTKKNRFGHLGKHVIQKKFRHSLIELGLAKVYLHEKVKNCPRYTYSVHSLKHCFSNQALKAVKYDLVKASKITGHASPFSLVHYIDDKVRDDAYQKMFSEKEEVDILQLLMKEVQALKSRNDELVDLLKKRGVFHGEQIEESISTNDS